MKFLIFNLAVAASLFYLLTTDRADFQRIAGNVHDAAGELKTMTERAVGNGRKLLDRTARTAPTATAPKIAETRPAPPAPAPQAMEPPPPAIPATRADIKAVANADPALTDPAPLDPTVAKRRGEVFAGIPPQPPEPKSPALKEGEPMMTPAQRRKELYSLAEEMELLYARTVSR